ncbi:hypothetical protein LEMLEM_LOCUS13971 [Lemmus lemmus]
MCSSCFPDRIFCFHDLLWLQWFQTEAFRCSFLEPWCGYVILPLLDSQGWKTTVSQCNTNNKNPGTDIGVQVEDQKSKADKPLESPQLYEICRLKERVPVSPCLIFLSSAGVHHHCPASMAD